MRLSEIVTSISPSPQSNGKTTVTRSKLMFHSLRKMTHFSQLPNETISEFWGYFQEPRDVENFAIESKDIYVIGRPFVEEHNKLKREYSIFETGPGTVQVLRRPCSRMSFSGHALLFTSPTSLSAAFRTNGRTQMEMVMIIFHTHKSGQKLVIPLIRMMIWRCSSKRLR